MLTGGVSLEVFKAWAPDPRNLVLLPGYQAAGTVGGKLMSGSVSEVRVGSSLVSVKCKVRYSAFSAHADVKGILQLVAATSPGAVMLVHGDRRGMEFLAPTITRLFGVSCTYPRTGDWSSIRLPAPPIPVTLQLDQRWLPRADPDAGGGTGDNAAAGVAEGDDWAPELPPPCNALPLQGVLAAQHQGNMALQPRLLHPVGDAGWLRELGSGRCFQVTWDEGASPCGVGRS